MKPQLTAGLLALSAHIGQEDTLAADLQALPFFRSFERGNSPMRVSGWLSQSQTCATSLANCPEDAPVKYMLEFARLAVDSGLRAFMAALGYQESLDETLHIREAGRLVVKNAFPKVLSCYAAGGFGDFTLHRLPFFNWPSSILCEDNPKLFLHNRIGDALLLTRHKKAYVTKKLVQANPRTAIRNQKTGKPISKWGKTQWQQITWRLGYTTVFDLLVLAVGEADETPAPAGLHTALLHLVSYCGQVFTAYLAPGATYQIAGEAYFIKGATALAA